MQLLSLSESFHEAVGAKEAHGGFNLEQHPLTLSKHFAFTITNITGARVSASVQARSITQFLTDRQWVQQHEILQYARPGRQLEPNH